jgi:ATP-binding protein involved in chromosome partitioning
MVTTPQEVALLDVRKAVAMFRKLNVPLLGVVENMSYFVCPHCHERTDIFGTTGGARIAEEFGVPLLAQLPLDPETRVGGDEGTPITVRRPDSPQAGAFRGLAEAVAARVQAAAPRLPSIS